MNKIIFECETITPMFLSGADRRTPELRAPSIKGALRFWWRAMHGHLPIEELREKEAKIFGGTGEKESKSLLRIKVENVNEKRGKYKLLPHHTGNFECKYCKETGIQGKCSKGFKMPCFAVTSMFDVIISFDKDRLKKIQVDFGSSANENYFKFLFEVFQILGGLGKRSRRGFGSFQMININFSMQTLVSNLNNISPSSFKLNNSENQIVNIRSDLKNNIPYIKEIFIGRSYISFHELLTTIGEASHSFNYKDGQLGYSNKSKGRMSSPLYVSVVKMSDKDYRPIITTLNVVLPNGRRIQNFENQEKFKEAIL